MSGSEIENQDAPVFNVVQIVAINIALTVSFCVGLKSVGASWLAALSGAWVGGSIATLGGVALVSWWHMRRASVDEQPAAAQPVSTSPPLVPATITDAYKAWEADRLLEIEHAISLKRVDEARKPRPAPPVTMVRMWEDDAAVDSEEARIAPKRAVRIERRNSDVPFEGEDRRRNRA